MQSFHPGRCSNLLFHNYQQNAKKPAAGCLRPATSSNPPESLPAPPRPLRRTLRCHQDHCGELPFTQNALVVVDGAAAALCVIFLPFTDPRSACQLASICLAPCWLLARPSSKYLLTFFFGAVSSLFVFLQEAHHGRPITCPCLLGLQLVAVVLPQLCHGREEIALIR